MLVYSVSKSKSAARPSYANTTANAMHGNKSPPPQVLHFSHTVLIGLLYRITASEN